MQYDPQVPHKLKKTQQWFGSVISAPISVEDKINSVAPSGNSIEKEAEEYIQPSPTLKSYQRIELYNQQFWWRLHSTLVDILPLVARLFSPDVMREVISIPYLCKYPPDHWSLNLLADRVPQWIEEEYHKKDKQLILDAARLDCAFNASFLSPQHKPLCSQTVSPSWGMQQLLVTPLSLQPHLYLFDHPYDLFSFRYEVLKEDLNHWVERDFPEMKKEKEHYYHILYRNHENNIGWLELTEGEYTLLKLFRKGCTVNEACTALENGKEDVYEEATLHLAKWLEKWVAYRWLAIQ